MIVSLSGSRCFVMSHLRPVQDKKFILSVMLAHCVSAGIPIGRLQQYGMMPVCENWNLIAYEWQDKYLDKLVRDLVLHGLWDSLDLCCEVVRACTRACARACMRERACAIMWAPFVRLV